MLNKELRCPLNRKTKGIFYTPARLSHLLSDWAVRSASDKVLEPSFGGFVFISAVVDKLSKLSCKAPQHNIFGLDIDEAAFVSLEKLFAAVPPSTQFFREDFLSAKSSVLGNKVEVVIGNPPYVSRHNMNDRQRDIVDAFVPECIDIFAACSSSTGLASLITCLNPSVIAHARISLNIDCILSIIWLEGSWGDISLFVI